MLLFLSLTYLKAAQRLTVTVNRARNLPLADRKGRLGLYLLAGLSPLNSKLDVITKLENQGYLQNAEKCTFSSRLTNSF